MQTALVVINPIAVARSRRSRERLRRLLFALSSAGIRTLTTTTRGPQHSPEQLFEEFQDFDAVLVVGGDGTANEVLQALMSRPDAKLGIFPMGSGNLVARHLGFRGNIEALVDELRHSSTTPHPVGTIEQLDNGRRRYWLGAAGIGADARVICGVSPGVKARFGIAAYFAEATRQLLFSAQPLPFFSVEFKDATGKMRCETVSQTIAETIGYFGDFLEPSAAPPLPLEQMRVVLFKTTRRAAFFHYGTRLLASQVLSRAADVTMRDVEVVRTGEIVCRPGPQAAPGQPMLAEIDGELFGELPVRLSLAARAVQVLSRVSA